MDLSHRGHLYRSHEKQKFWETLDVPPRAAGQYPKNTIAAAMSRPDFSTEP